MPTCTASDVAATNDRGGGGGGGDGGGGGGGGGGCGRGGIGGGGIAPAVGKEIGVGIGRSAAPSTP